MSNPQSRNVRKTASKAKANGQSKSVKASVQRKPQPKPQVAFQKRQRSRKAEREVEAEIEHELHERGRVHRHNRTEFGRAARPTRPLNPQARPAVTDQDTAADAIKWNEFRSSDAAQAAYFEALYDPENGPLTCVPYNPRKCVPLRLRAELKLVVNAAGSAMCICQDAIAPPPLIIGDTSVPENAVYKSGFFGWLERSSTAGQDAIFGGVMAYSPVYTGGDPTVPQSYSTNHIGDPSQPNSGFVAIPLSGLDRDNSYGQLVAHRLSLYSTQSLIEQQGTITICTVSETATLPFDGKNRAAIFDTQGIDVRTGPINELADGTQIDVIRAPISAEQDEWMQLDLRGWDSSGGYPAPGIQGLSSLATAPPWCVVFIEGAEPGTEFVFHFETIVAYSSQTYAMAVDAPETNGRLAGQRSLAHAAAPAIVAPESADKMGAFRMASGLSKAMGPRTATGFLQAAADTGGKIAKQAAGMVADAAGESWLGEAVEVIGDILGAIFVAGSARPSRRLFKSRSIVDPVVFKRRKPKISPMTMALLRMSRTVRGAPADLGAPTPRPMIALLQQIANNTAAIEDSDALIADHTDDIRVLNGTMLSDLDTIAVDSNYTVTYTGNTATSAAAIAGSTATTASNTGTVATNTGNTATSAATIATNSGTIATNTGNTATNTASTATSCVYINTNTAASANQGDAILGRLPSALSAGGGIKVHEVASVEEEYPPKGGFVALPPTSVPSHASNWIEAYCYSPKQDFVRYVQRRLSEPGSAHFIRDVMLGKTTPSGLPPAYPGWMPYSAIIGDGVRVRVTPTGTVLPWDTPCTCGDRIPCEVHPDDARVLLDDKHLL